MQDALLVGRLHREGDLPAEVDRQAVLERMAFGQHGQGGAGDQLHHHPEIVAVLHDVVDLHDRRMVEAGQRPGLAAETLPALEILAAVQPLERHLAGQAVVPGEVDLAHAAAAEQALETVGADLFELDLGWHRTESRGAQAPPPARPARRAPRASGCGPQVGSGGSGWRPPSGPQGATTGPQPPPPGQTSGLSPGLPGWMGAGPQRRRPARGPGCRRDCRAAAWPPDRSSWGRSGPRRRRPARPSASGSRRNSVSFRSPSSLPRPSLAWPTLVRRASSQGKAAPELVTQSLPFQHCPQRAE